MKQIIDEPQQSTLTQKMDIGTQGFNDFQAILLKRSSERTEDQRRDIDLVTIKYQMEDYLVSNRSEIKPAGEFLKTILKTLNIQQKQFAEYLDLRPSNLSKLISGERPISHDMALILSQLFNHSPMLWIEIQAKNDLNRLIATKRKKYSLYSLNDLLRKKRSTM
ncbi:MAG: addiction module HigA family antidote [Spirosomataceae bacterium]|jgi:addiction module HigA family antidote